MSEFTDYRDNGFRVFDDLEFGRRYVSLAEVRSGISRLFHLQVSSLGLETARGGGALHKNMRALLKADVTRYIATARMAQELPSLHAFLATLTTYLTYLRIKTPVFSTKASVHIMADDLVIPGGYHRSPPHQDWRSIQGSLDNVVLWIPLTPVRGNGLEVIRGSHKHGLLPTRDHVMTPEVIDPERLGPWEAIDMDPGDVLAFSSFLVHRTAEGPGLRIAISTRFNNAAEPTFIERGYPSPYKYSYQRELITPDFPPKGPA